MRYAIVTAGHKREEVRSYLPANYEIVRVDPNGAGILIAGEDNAGWTLDEYVIPRLGSGLIACREVWPVFSHPDKPGPYVAMDIPEEWLRVPS